MKFSRRLILGYPWKIQTLGKILRLKKSRSSDENGFSRGRRQKGQWWWKSKKYRVGYPVFLGVKGFLKQKRYKKWPISGVNISFFNRVPIFHELFMENWELWLEVCIDTVQQLGQRAQFAPPKMRGPGSRILTPKNYFCQSEKIFEKIFFIQNFPPIFSLLPYTIFFRQKQKSFSAIRSLN